MLLAHQQAASQPVKAVFTDLDGSLRHNELGIHTHDHSSLLRLGELGVARIIATGRSLFSARKALSPDFPIDYLIFSSGAGILNWQTQELLCSHGLNQAEISQVISCLQDLDLDFMLHDKVPNNHHFWYWRRKSQSQSTPDFERRLELYQGYATPLSESLPEGPCAQFVAIAEAAQTEQMFDALCKRLPDLSIIRATSPLDEQSGWLEVFPAHVSKSQASHWLSEKHQWQSNMAFGNDYNDTDLLAWSDRAFVADNAPEVLTKLYEKVPCPARAGFSQAVSLWLQE